MSRRRKGLVNVRVQVDPVMRALRQLERRARDLRPALRDTRSPFRTEQRRHFRDEQGPDGPWPRRAAASESRVLGKACSAAKKKGRKRRPRRAPKMLGKLRQFKVRVRRRTIVAESPIKWSGVHQRGGRVGRGAMVPAR
ncbi:MAG: phage virion morphogenesis protein, partial [Myxococcota bacterium]